MSKRRFGPLLLADAGAMVLVMIAAWFFGQGSTLIGAAIGNVFGLINLAMLAWSVKRVIDKASAGKKAIYGGFIAVKLLIVFGAVFALIVVLEVDAIGFALGYTAVLMALIVAGLVSVWREAN